MDKSSRRTDQSVALPAGAGSISPALYRWRAPSSITLLPSQVEGNSVQFAPPDDFVQVLNSLSAAP